MFVWGLLVSEVAWIAAFSNLHVRAAFGFGVCDLGNRILLSIYLANKYSMPGVKDPKWLFSWLANLARVN